MKKLIIAATSAGLLLLAACSNDGKDFSEDAEKFIESTEVESQLAHTFTDAACTEPDKIEAGEIFTCTAVDETGTTWDFEVTVQSENSYEITDGGPRT